MNPSDFNVGAHYFPLTDTEKEAKCILILAKLNIVEATEDMQFQYIGTMPCGEPIFLVLPKPVMTAQSLPGVHNEVNPMGGSIVL